MAEPTHKSFETLFKTLGIDLAGRDPKTIPPDDIKKARDTLLKKLHEANFVGKPDADRLAAQEQLKEVNAAYTILKDPASIDKHAANIRYEAEANARSQAHATGAEPQSPFTSGAGQSSGGSGWEDPGAAKPDTQDTANAGSSAKAKAKADARKASQEARRTASSSAGGGGGGYGGSSRNSGGSAGHSSSRRSYSWVADSKASKKRRGFIDWAVLDTAGEIHGGKVAAAVLGVVAAGAAYGFFNKQPGDREPGFADREAARAAGAPSSRAF